MAERLSIREPKNSNPPEERKLSQSKTHGKGFRLKGKTNKRRSVSQPKTEFEYGKSNRRGSETSILPKEDKTDQNIFIEPSSPQHKLKDENMSGIHKEIDEILHDDSSHSIQLIHHERQNIQSMQGFLQHHMSSRDKLMRVLAVLSKIPVSQCHIELVSTFCQILVTHESDQKLISLVMDTAHNLQCHHDKTFTVTLIEVTRNNAFDDEFLAKLIPFVGDIGVDVIIDIMSRSLHSTEIAKKGCLYFSKASELKDEIVQSEGISVVNIVLKVHRKNPEVVPLALSAIQNFTNNESLKQTMEELLALEDLLSVLSLHRDNMIIQDKGLKLVLAFAENIDFSSEEALEIGDKIKVVILQVMETSSKSTMIQESSCRILYRIPIGKHCERIMTATLNALDILDTAIPLLLLIRFSSQMEFVKKLISEDKILPILYKINQCEDNIVTVEKGCALLCNILHFADDCKETSCNVIRLLTKCMMNNLENSNIQSSALPALYRYAFANREEFLHLNCGMHVLQCLRTHTGVPKIQEYGCAVVTILMTSNADVIDNLEGLLVLLSAMLMHSSDKKFQDRLCSSFGTIFEAHSRDQIWIQEYTSFVEAAIFDYPYDIKKRIKEAILIKSSTRPSTEYTSIEQVYSNTSCIITPSVFEVVIIIPPSIDKAKVIDKITKGSKISGSNDYDEYSALGIERYDWHAFQLDKNSIIKLNILQITNWAPLGLLFSRKAFYVLIWEMNTHSMKPKNKGLPTRHINSNVAGSHVMDFDARVQIIDQNAVQWINLINSLVPGASILPICVTSGCVKTEEHTQNKNLIKMHLNKRFSSNSTYPCNRPNIIFDENFEVDLRKTNHGIYGLTELKENIKQFVQIEQDRVRSIELTRKHPDTQQGLEIFRQLQQNFHVMKMDECLLYARTMTKNPIPEGRLNDALTILLAKGEVFCYEVEMESYIVLNSSWIISAVKNIFESESFDDIVLEIKETKYDLDIEDEESYPFLEVCLNCPIVTREDMNLLLENTEYTDNVAVECDRAANILRQMLIQQGEIIPLELGIRNPSQELYLLPHFLAPENDSYWTYKTSSSKKNAVVLSWLLTGTKPHDLMKNISKEILQEAYVIQQYNEVWETSVEVPQHDNVTLREILCWQNALLLKLSVKIKNASSSSTEEYVDISLYYGDKNSPLCVSSDSMKDGEKRLILSAKGGSEEIGAMMDGGYLMFESAVERVLSTYTNLKLKRQIVCPTCLASYNIREAEVWDKEDLGLMTQDTIQCAKGHHTHISDLLR